MKHIAWLVTVLLLLGCYSVICVQVGAETTASGICGENLTWTLNDAGTLTISGTGAMKNYEYTNRAPWSGSRSSIKQIDIGAGVTTIGDYAFYDCDGLTVVTIPDNVTSIGKYSFYGDSGLTSVTIGDNVSMIGDEAFSWCDCLTSLTIGNSVASIGNSAFSSCTSLASVTIPESVTTIGYWAFYGCDSLTSFRIPGSVTSIGDFAFYYCSSLLEIHVDENNPAYSNDAYGMLFNKDKTVLLQMPGGYSGNYVIPDGVIAIGARAFCYCANLSSVMVPDSVAAIGDYAFYRCWRFTDLYFAGTEEQWAQIIIGENNSDLSYASMHYKTVLSGLSVNTLPAKTQYFVGEALDTTGLKLSLAYSDGTSQPVLSGYTTTKYSSEEIGTKTVYVWYEGFFTSFEVEVVEVITGICGTNLSWKLTKDGMLNISGTGEMYLRYTAAPWSAWRDRIKQVTIAEGVTSIGNSAFSDCTALECITAADSVTSIGSNAFQNCISLTDASIGEGVALIEDRAFAGCSAMTSLEIPNGVETLNAYCFGNCIGLKSVTLGSGVASIDPLAFYGCSGLETFCTDEANESYMADPSGVLCSRDGSAVVMAPAGLSGSYVITDGVTEICTNAFCGCIRLTKVTVPVGMTVIGNSAFMDCSALKTVLYMGTVDQWEELIIGGNNTCLTGAKLRTIDSLAHIAVKMPVKVYYERNEAPDIDGLMITATYTDGSTEDIGEGFAVSQFDTATAGARTVTVVYLGKETSYTVYVDILMPGDVDRNGSVNEDDAIYLLQHVMMPELFLIEQEADYDKNGTIDEDDAIYLLQYAMMPELFPL